MPGKITRPEKEALKAKIWTDMSKIFDQVGASITNHGKNFVALYKIHIDAAQRTEKVHNGRHVRLVGEGCFEDRFAHSLLRALPQKRGMSEADRVIKFTGGYIRFVNEKGVFECDIWNGF
jgi:condensin complex subunit 3